MNPDEVLKEGKLTKRGTGYPFSWRDRHFTLTSKGLQYATTDGVGKGSFAMNKNSIVTTLSIADMPGKKSPFGFKVTTGVDDLYMFASSDAERAEWVQAIVSALNIAPAVASSSPKRAPLSQPVAGETRVDELKRRLEEHKQAVIARREATAQETQRMANLKQQQHLAAIASENSETMSLGRLLAECRIAEDAAKHAELKKTQQRLAETHDNLDFSSSSPEDHARYDAESASLKAEWAKLAQRAAQYSQDHVVAEGGYNAARMQAEAAVEAADAAEAEAARLRAISLSKLDREAAAKMDYEYCAMLASAPWTADFKAEVEARLNDPKLRRIGTMSSSKNVAAAGSAATGGPAKAPVTISRRDQFQSAMSSSKHAFVDLESRRKVEKKLGSDHNFYDRFIWVDEDTGCFHWAKSARTGSGSKCVHIASVVKAVLLCRAPKGANWIGFSLSFYPDLDKKHFNSARGVTSADECIDVKVVGDDAVAYVECMCKRIIEIIKQTTAERAERGAASASATATAK